MKLKKLGQTSLNVAPIAFGGNVFGWTLNESASFQMLDELNEAGLNFIDTADAYSSWVPGNKGGESETIIGNWFKKSGKRSQVVLATKVGWEITPDRKGLSKAYILKTVNESLKRLQTDYIDLYQAHKDDPATPLEETLSAFDQLVREGKVLSIGASNYGATRLNEALDISAANNWASFTTIQPLYNLYDRSEFEGELANLTIQKNLTAITYFSLASGFLTGKYRSEADLSTSARGGSVKTYLNERGLKILGTLDAVAQKHGCVPASVALAWLMSRPGVGAPIASATSSSQLQALIKASTLQLDKQDLDSLSSASA
ncbi:MAG TPA: aldo/keto reductase [Eoetvoesiella sp.]